MNRETYSDYKMAISAINKFTAVDQTVDFDYYTDIYTEYLSGRGKPFDLDAYNCSNQRAIIRLCCMARCHEPKHADYVKEAFRELPPHVKQILRRELTVTGNEDEGGILLYYSPALMNNVWKCAATEAKSKKMNDEDTKKEMQKWLVKGLELMAKCYQVARENKSQLPKFANEQSTDRVLTASILQMYDK
jgi:hypothetical protein